MAREADASPEIARERARQLEEKLLEIKGQLAHAVGQNEKLSYTLRESREHIASLRDEVEKLTQPPSGYGVIVGKNDDSTVDILTSGRKMRVTVHPEIDFDGLERGAEVVHIHAEARFNTTQESSRVSLRPQTDINIQG